MKDLLRPQKRILVPRHNMELNGRIIKSTLTIKFLGLHIDRELRWKEQIVVAIGKGREWLRQCSRLAKTSAGISGRQMRKIYLVVVVPRHYESFKVRKGGQTALNKLTAIQRCAALLRVGGLCSLPNDMLHMHTNFLPFHLVVNKVCF